MCSTKSPGRVRKNGTGSTCGVVSVDPPAFACASEDSLAGPDGAPSTCAITSLLKRTISEPHKTAICRKECGRARPDPTLPLARAVARRRRKRMGATVEGLDVLVSSIGQVFGVCVSWSSATCRLLQSRYAMRLLYPTRKNVRNGLILFSTCDGFLDEAYLRCSGSGARALYFPRREISEIGSNYF